MPLKFSTFCSAGGHYWLPLPKNIERDFATCLKFLVMNSTETLGIKESRRIKSFTSRLENNIESFLAQKKRMLSAIDLARHRDSVHANKTSSLDTVTGFLTRLAHFRVSVSREARHCFEIVTPGDAQGEGAGTWSIPLIYILRTILGDVPEFLMHIQPF